MASTRRRRDVSRPPIPVPHTYAWRWRHLGGVVPANPQLDRSSNCLESLGCVYWTSREKQQAVSFHPEDAEAVCPRLFTRHSVYGRIRNLRGRVECRERDGEKVYRDERSTVFGRAALWCTEESRGGTGGRAGKARRTTKQRRRGRKREESLSGPTW